MGFTPGALVPTAVVAALVVWSHRANISRLCAGTENAFSIRKK
jgi:glycerol-3-phosphate acyltransferase PlsY